MPFSTWVRPRHLVRRSVLLAGVTVLAASGLGVSAADAAETAGATAVTVAPVPQSALAQSPTDSPVVDVDGFATFTFSSATATKVSITGSWAPSYGPATSDLFPSGPGTFSTIIGPLEPGLYSYTLTVDGVSTGDPLNPNAVHVNPALREFLVPGRSASFLTRHRGPHGAVSQLTYRSDVTGSDRNAIVWTPPGYASSKASLPAFYLFHGGGGDYFDWVQQGRANVILDNLWAAGRLRPMVVVMGDGNVDGATGLPQDDQFVPELLGNLVPAVHQAFRVRTGAKNQALAGLSLGGLQTFNTLLTDPGEFAYVGDFSSGYFPPVLDGIRSSGLLTRSRVAEINRGTKLFRIYIGNRSDIAYQNNILTRELFDDYGIRYQFAGVYPEAGHTWKTWQHDLNDFAPRLFR